MDVGESIEWLTSIPGEGRKTESSVLLFSFGQSAFPVDTHVLRLSKRLKLIDENISADLAHNLFVRFIIPEIYYQTHMDMIEHGRTVCIASKPNCKECVLNTICPSASL